MANQPERDAVEKRLIEVAFPLEQVSLDSVHEKNVRHGHISTLHIWPARRPLAASRAALIAMLLPDPGNARERQAIYRRMAGKVVETVEDERVGGRTVARRKRKMQGGILDWKRENGQDLDWFRARIRDASDGREPRVLDPFAGGGAIPLEAMRLGCAVTAVDINPVAWFILKCTLDYPRQLAGETRPLPEFALRDRDFMAAFLKAKGVKGRALKRELAELGLGGDEGTTEPRLLDARPALEADLAWQVRTLGRRVLAAARQRLAHRYPTYAAFRALKPGGRPFEARPPALLAPDAEGNTDVGPLNTELDAIYLKDPRNPRWVKTPTVAYLWARTVRCKGCRATIPLLKTRWLAKKGAKRVRLTMTPNAESTGVVFGLEVDVPPGEGNPARRREHDRLAGGGTMSRSGVQCPLCQTIMTMQDLRLDGRAGRLAEVMTAVVIDGPHGKEHRLPTDLELQAARVEQAELDALYAEIPFGRPDEPTPKAGVGASRAFSVDGYGFDKWRTLFTNRQLLALGTFVQEIRRLPETMAAWPEPWREAVVANLTPTISRLADRGSTLATWTNDPEKVRSTFARFALPMVWDFVEACPLADTSGGFVQAVEWTAEVCEHLLAATRDAHAPAVLRRSAAEPQTAADGDDGFDLICTDPPYCGVQAELQGRHGAGVLAVPRRTAGRRPVGDRLRQQVARRLGDAGLGADPGRVRGGRLVADSDRAAGENARLAVRRPRLLHLDRLPQAPGGASQSGTPRCSPRCARTSPSSFATSGSPASAAPTSCGRRPDRRWKRSRSGAPPDAPLAGRRRSEGQRLSRRPGPEAPRPRSATPSSPGCCRR